MIRLLFFVSFVLLLGGAGFGQCPTISVSGPPGVTNRGEKVKFRADVSAVGPRLEFSWTISSGVIAAGQGTLEITVVPDGDTTVDRVAATVTVEGLPTGCEKSASDSAPLDTVPVCGMPIDEWGDAVSLNDQRGRLDAIFAELSQAPKQTGFLMLYILAEDRLDSKNSRIQFVRKHAKFRKFDISRIWFGLEVWDEERTKVFRFEIQPDSTLPCDKCLIIKGGDL